MYIVPFAPSIGAFCRYVILFSAIVQIITLYVILCTRSEERIGYAPEFFSTAVKNGDVNLNGKHLNFHHC